MKKILLLTLVIFLLTIASLALAQEKETIRKNGMVACFGKETLIAYLKGIHPSNKSDCYVLQKGGDVAVIKESDNLIQIKPWKFKSLNFLDNLVELWTTKEAIQEGKSI